MGELEADFALQELFFSKTNKKGIIESGNSVFIRVSEYEKEELTRKPHNIIRHDDTPRSVFKLFWDQLNNQKPIAAYVKNRSKTGRFYWVFAMAFPLNDGYLSIRLKPTSKYFSVVQRLYQDLVAAESEGCTLEAGVGKIEEELKKLGFVDYATFMITALVEEMTCRDQQLGADKQAHLHQPAETLDALSQILRNSNLNTISARASYAKTQNLFQKSADLLKECHGILETCRRVKFVTLNLMVSSSQLREAGKPLSTVAMNLQDLTSQIAESSTDFEGIFRRYEKSVFEIFVAVAISRFQIEMMNQLAEEIVQLRGPMAEIGAAEAEEFHRNCEPLRYLINENFHQVGMTSLNLDRTTRSLLESIQTLNKVTSGMGVLHVVGKIEMARVGATESLGARLSEMSVFNEAFKNNLGTLERECKLNLGLCAELSTLEKQIKSRLG